MKKLMLLTLFAALLAACSIAGGGGDLQGSWLLTAMPGYPSVPEEVTLTFDPAQNRVFGNGGCNSYSGTYSAQGSQLSIGEDMVMTLMACPDMSWSEGEYLQTLSSASAYAVNGDELVLTVAGGEMVFARATGE